MASISQALAIALAHHRAGRLDLAEEVYRRVLEVEPDQPDALHLAGVVAHQRGRHEQAIAHVARAIRADDGQPHYHNTLGEAYRALGRIPEAIACYQQAIQIRPDDAAYYNNLGLAWEELEKVDEAVACYRQAIELQPDLAEAHNNLGNALQDRGQLDHALACYRQALALDPDYSTAHSNYLYALRYHPGVTLAVLADAHREYDRRHTARFRADWQAHENSRDPARLLRLGFVAKDFCRGPLGSFLIRGLENLDRGRFSIWCYSNSPAADEMTARFAAVASAWRTTATLGDAQLAAEIRQDQIDILFDLAGHALGRRLFVFARKPAPIQITWLDSVGTTGLVAIDYLLADRHLVPPEAEAHSVERVLRMPDSYVCFEPPQAASAVAPLPALEQGHVTFGSFSRPAKIHAQLVKAWSQILRRVPGSRLLLKHRGLDSPGTGRHFRQLFEAEGFAPARIELQGYSPPADYLAQYRRIDLVLDPLPHSGGLTTCDALWMGVPVVTCPGETFASRQSLSHLSAIGLTETIAADVPRYVDLAVELSGNLARLAEIRAGLRDRVARSPLCDGNRFAANLTTLLRRVWREWTRSE